MKNLYEIDFLTPDYTYKLQEKSRNNFRFIIAIVFFLAFLLPLLYLFAANQKLEEKQKDLYQEIKELANRKIEFIEKAKLLEVEINNMVLLNNLNNHRNYCTELNDYISNFNEDIWVKKLTAAFPFKNDLPTKYNGTAILKDLFQLNKLVKNQDLFKDKIESTNRTIINDQHCVEIHWGEFE